MTDRVYGAYVVFDKDYRDDDVEPILDAIRMTKGVASVDSSQFVRNPETFMARGRVRAELGDALSTVMHALLSDQVIIAPGKDATLAHLKRITKMIEDAHG